MRLEVIAGRLEIAHGPLAGMAFQIERDAVLLAGVQNGAEAFDQQFQADLAHVGNGVAGDAGRAAAGTGTNGSSNGPANRRSRAAAPCGSAACRGSAARRTHGHAGRPGLAGGSACRPRRARNTDRCAAACCPCRARPCTPRPASPPTNCSVLALGSSPRAWPCRCVGDGEDFQAVLLGQVDAFLGVGLGAGVGVAAVEIEFPARLFPAVEAGLCDELEPFVHRHVAELAANQADLMIRSLAVAMRRRLLEAHDGSSFPLWWQVLDDDAVTISPFSALTSRMD